MIKYGIPIYIILIILFLTLTGCSTPPRFLADYYNKSDPCQMKFKAADHMRPSFCGKGKTPSKVIIYDYYTNHPVKY